jgi:hypothetical protein
VFSRARFLRLRISKPHPFVSFPVFPCTPVQADAKAEAKTAEKRAHEDIKDASSQFHPSADLIDTGRPPRPLSDKRKVGVYSCRTTLKRELLTWIPPLYWMKPRFLNLFMKKLTRGRVVPIISASIPCDTLGSTL